MVGLIIIALKKPYTFIVLGIVILLFGVLAIVTTPKDIFPNIGIPVVAVVWTYNELPPAVAKFVTPGRPVCRKLKRARPP